MAIYTKGLICKSCGIGIRKQLGKLAQLDKTKLNKGVSFDLGTQLVTIALKPNQSLSTQTVAEAIKKAGYTPVKAYTVKNGKVVSTPIK